MYKYQTLDTQFTDFYYFSSLLIKSGDRSIQVHIVYCVQFCSSETVTSNPMKLLLLTEERSISNIFGPVIRILLNVMGKILTRSPIAHLY